MARSRETKIELTAYDDLFQTDESREEAKLSKIRDIPISEIDEFPDHPFKVLMDEDMEQLVESIKRNGVMTPATVRLKEDGRYELISGHRRKKACELAGLETLKCEVKELTRDEAIIVMVESNLQRSAILPSEKAFAYKMRLEAMKRQGERSDLTSSPMGTKLRSDAELAEKVGESRNQIQRYIRLTELVPEILQMVDERQIAFRPAVEISYLTEEQQYTLLEAMEYNDATPSLAQAIKMKKFNQDGKLTSEVIQSIMEEEKPNQKEKPAFRDERITKLIPKTVPRGQETDFVVKALEFYNRHFKHGEVTPEQAHEVGVKLAERMWGDRFQVIVATHLNTDCLHNHFVVNSVSFADGMHYHDNKANLRLLRQRSDELCREYALSVIEHPSGKKKPYALYQAEKQGRPTRDNVARQAVDEAISKSFTLKDFDRQLAEMGYRINFDPNRKYWTIIGKG